MHDEKRPTYHASLDQRQLGNAQLRQPRERRSQ
jgi:hypothetical protein